jgi:ABC-type tungstate transport system permease subunit
MTLSSYSDVFSVVHDREHEEEILAGDIVRCGANHYPHFEVIAVSGDKAWVRNVLNGTDSLALISRCRRLETGSLRVAAE